jgi:hypothetical protein
MNDDWSFLFSSFTEMNMVQMFKSQINITPLSVDTMWTCRSHISTSYTARFLNAHIQEMGTVLLTTMFLQFFIFIHTWWIILYTMVNSLHYKYTRHCT